MGLAMVGGLSRRGDLRPVAARNGVSKICTLDAAWLESLNPLPDDPQLSEEEVTKSAVARRRAGLSATARESFDADVTAYRELQEAYANAPELDEYARIAEFVVCVPDSLDMSFLGNKVAVFFETERARASRLYMIGSRILAMSLGSDERDVMPSFGFTRNPAVEETDYKNELRWCRLPMPCENEGDRHAPFVRLVDPDWVEE